MIRLNLGSGNKWIEGYTNVDWVAQDGVDRVVDLSIFPWPWDDNSVDEVFTSHWLEHMEDPEKCMREIHRILKPGRKLTIYVPHNAGVLAYSRAHIHRFSTIWFHGWIQKRRHLYSFKEDPLLFTDSSIKLRFISEGLYPYSVYPWWVHAGLAVVLSISKSIECIFNSHVIMQFAWEKTGILPPDEIRFTARKI